MPRIRLTVEGIDCADEVMLVRRALEAVQGVRDAEASALGPTVVVTADDAVQDRDLIGALARAGFRARREGAGDARAAEQDGEGRSLRTITTLLSGFALTLGFATHVYFDGWLEAISRHERDALPLSSSICYGLAIALGASFVLPRAVSSARRLRPDMNLLMTVAILGAIVLGEWLEAATVSFLFALSLALEAWTVGRARRAIASLVDLRPPQARVVDGAGAEELLDVESVGIGKRVVVKTGERIPLDARILVGVTSVDQAPITGESTPVPKGPGDEVSAGSINQVGAIEVEVLRRASDSTLAQVVRLVEEAQRKRSPTELWIDRFAARYTPAILLLALLVALVPPLFGGAFGKWFYESLSLLVIACPCALVISTPVSVVASLVSAARHGVLVKGGQFIELSARLSAIALDKTGTLTSGRPEVAEVRPLSGHSEAELLEIALAVELRSEHPVGQAIVRHATGMGVRAQPVEQYTALGGKGALATLDGREVWLGSHRFLEERAEETPAIHDLIEGLSSAGKSVVVVGEGGHVCGVITLVDALRPESMAAIADLRARGVERVVMLTGDNLATARAIAAATGIEEFQAELVPQDKVAALEKLLSAGGVVAMIGDGVNDAPALARAHVGIAMGAAGSTAAIETADIALMKDDLSKVPWLIDHARRTMRIIRMNIALSLVTKSVFVLLAVLGQASLWAAIAADTGVSLAVVVNALRLLRSGDVRA